MKKLIIDDILWIISLAKEGGWKMNIRKITYERILGIVLLVGFLFLTGSGMVFAAGDKVKIGAAVSLSGMLTKEGTGVKKGYDFWADWANARGGITIGGKKYNVEMIFYDDESNPQRSAKLVEKLITEDKVDVVMGPYGSGIAMASTTIAERYGYAYILPLCNSDVLFTRGYKNIFGVFPVASRDAVSFLDLMKNQVPKPETIAIISVNSTYPLLLSEGANDYLKQEGGLKVVALEKFPSETSDLSSLISSLKTKNPDILLEAGYYEHSVLITRQMKELKFSPKALFLSVGPQIPDFVKNLGKDAEYSMATAPWHSKMKFKDPAFTNAEYCEMFNKKYKENPDLFSAFGTAGGRLLEQALEKAGSLDQDKIRLALRNIALTDTIVGPIKFDEAGRNALGKIGVLQIQKGQGEVVNPIGAATSKVWYPAVPWEKR